MTSPSTAATLKACLTNDAQWLERLGDCYHADSLTQRNYRAVAANVREAAERAESAERQLAEATAKLEKVETLVSKLIAEWGQDDPNQMPTSTGYFNDDLRLIGEALASVPTEGYAEEARLQQDEEQRIRKAQASVSPSTLETRP